MPHIPVMVEEVISHLIWEESGTYVDCTVGDGMHSRAILERIVFSGGKIIGIDRDKRALKQAEMNLQDFNQQTTLQQLRFSEIGRILMGESSYKFSGFFFDLGLNTSRLEEAESGFSYLVDGPLDMRMSAEDRITAGDIINNWSEKELADMFYYNSDERHSRKIARAIVKARELEPVRTTFQLKELICKVVKGPHKIKSVARCFQALRMAVNNEVNELKQGLKAAFTMLKPGGRIVVLSYHSIEDRIVKNFFREHKLPKKPEGGKYFRIMTKKPLRPDEQECRLNSAARSARMRAVEMVLVADG